MNRPPTLPTSNGPFTSSSAACQPLSTGLAVQSRLLASVAYEPEQAILQLEFRGGSVYQYSQVPRSTYQALLQAASKGAYFNRHIRNIFPCARLQPRA
jgi:hypothetical protein